MVGSVSNTPSIYDILKSRSRKTKSEVYEGLSGLLLDLNSKYKKPKIKSRSVEPKKDYQVLGEAFLNKIFASYGERVDEGEYEMVRYNYGWETRLNKQELVIAQYNRFSNFAFQNVLKPLMEGKEIALIMSEILANPITDKDAHTISDIETAKEMLDRDQSNFNFLDKTVLFDSNLWDWMVQQSWFEDRLFIYAYCFDHLDIADKIVDLLNSCEKRYKQLKNYNNHCLFHVVVEKEQKEELKKEIDKVLEKNDVDEAKKLLAKIHNFVAIELSDLVERERRVGEKLKKNYPDPEDPNYGSHCGEVTKNNFFIECAEGRFDVAEESTGDLFKNPINSLKIIYGRL